MQSLWLAFVVALAAVLALTPVARRVARRLCIVDAPDGKRKLQTASIPLLGGVAVYLAVTLALLLAGPIAPGSPAAFWPLALAAIVAGFFVCALGCYDDSRDLAARFKLLLQFASVLPVILAGYSVDRIVVFGQPVELGFFGIPLTALWLVGCINAFNLLDGMDGLASTVGLTTAAIMAVIALAHGNAQVALVALALAGALGGFLAYNLPPARIYLGDSGSMVIGLVVGLLAIQGSMKTAATLSITTPFVVMCLPMLDTALAVIRRRLAGQSIAKADRGHIHHRLLERGLTTWQALCVIGAICLATGAAAAVGTFLKSEGLTWILTASLLVLLVRTRAVAGHEIGLVKLKIAQAGAALVDRLMFDGLQGSRPLYGGMSDFDAAWQALSREAQELRLARLEMIWLSDGRPTASRTWNAAPQADRAAASASRADWSIGLSFGDSQAESFRVIAVVPYGARPEAWQVLRLVRLLSACGATFAETPEPLRLASPRLFVGSDAAVPVSRDDAAEQTRRAA
ncbi:MAG: undecaprenyl/decaprenyl-phosphate alpha-N-acetylglucosaminyl 1-phosphate transferase [Planctomycetia bacterium]|nr:undecaprenyl/decaprenyl-phosphate alpha-N-acetylglucosaminyl 1-phosphate transferase [Planctomycetia bacterium]